MNKEQLTKLFDILFDENRNIKDIENKKEQLSEFCYLLNLITGIQCYDARGGLYSYWYSIYLSALDFLDE